MQYSSDAPDASLCYWTTVDEANRITTLNDYMDKLALSKDWGNRNTVKVARIPAGIEVKYAVGTRASYTSGYHGMYFLVEKKGMEDVKTTLKKGSNYANSMKL